MYDESHIGNDVYSTQYKCPHCGSMETDYDGYCVHCGELVVQYDDPEPQPIKAKRATTKSEKPKKKKHKALGIALIVVGFLLFACAVGGNSNDSSTPSSATFTTNVASNETKEEQQVQETKIEYTDCTVDDMMSALESNPLNASNTYKNQYVAVTGRLAVVDASGKYIAVFPIDNQFAIIGVQCYTHNDQELINVISTLGTGDNITVYGKITDVGEVIGYSMDIDRIEK